MSAVLWLIPALAAGRLGTGLAAPYPTSRKEDTSTQLSQDAETAGQYEPPSSFSFGFVSPALLPGSAPGEDGLHGGAQASDGLQVQAQAETSFAGMDLTGATGLAFQCSLPTELLPCATEIQYVKEGAQPVELPNALPYACYRTVINENVHTLSVVALAAATAEAPQTSTLEDKHTFAISVPTVAADRTKAQYDAGTGAFSVKLFPADDSKSEIPPVSFAQLDAQEALMVHRFVADPAAPPPSKAKAVVGGGMREIRGP
jgi:hypothetical protein